MHDSAHTDDTDRQFRQTMTARTCVQPTGNPDSGSHQRHNLLAESCGNLSHPSGPASRNRLCSRPVSLPKRPILADLTIVLVLIAIAVAGYRFSPLLLPKADLTVTPDPTCDLNREACRAVFPGGTVELAITPRPIPVVKSLTVSVVLRGTDARKVDIDFSGATMNMGYNRLTLQPTEPGRFVGEASLPVCVTGRMEWLATVIVETDSRRIAVPFRFEAPSEGS
jgi:hypothetical protein